ncbi:MAG TPA: hypothetical protein VL098_04980 [Flavipsychrobacter sp.]|nr:hypothetical protein [Flavipsychrobacter sp.]
MKILFVENRYKTGFWEMVAQELIKDGHEIHWIVQNRLFQPKTGHSVVIPYFRNQRINRSNITSDLIQIIASNRGLNYFGIPSDNFIFYYREQVVKAIDDIAPDIVFGESTMFHELLIISACKERNIVYLHPSTCRYPTGRFSFYLYDSLEPFAGSQEKLSEKDALAIIDQIVNRKVVPDYMKVIKPVMGVKDRLANKWKLSLSYVLGERYNTPSPIIKKKIEQQKEHLIKAWDTLAKDTLETDTRYKILYPLQMQPEANIDVWGYPHNNQLEIIKRIAAQLKEDQVLYIKPNPKSKYELTEKLVSFIRDHQDKVVALAHHVPMTAVFPRIDFVVTVTGTIAYECVWAGKPFIALGKSLVSEYAWRDHLSAPIHVNEFQPFPDEQKVQLINELNRTSFKGNIVDTLLGKEQIASVDNMTHVVNAFRTVLHKISHPRKDAVPVL